MKTICLDGSELTDLRACFDLIARELSFPDYFGYNLDALYDCLGDVCTPVTFVTRNEKQLYDALGQDAFLLLSVLYDAAEENPFLTAPEMHA